MNLTHHHTNHQPLSATRFRRGCDQQSKGNGNRVAMGICGNGERLDSPAYLPLAAEIANGSKPAFVPHSSSAGWSGATTH